MCIRVTLIFEDKYDEVGINTIAKMYGRIYKAVNNPVIVSQLSKNDMWFEAAHTGCECNTGIGSYELFTRNVENLIKEVNDKSIVEEIRSEEVKRKAIYKNDVDDWEVFIKDLIRKYGFNRVGLLVHFVDNDLTMTGFTILDKQVFKYSNINSELLMKIENDIIYYFVDDDN